MAGKSNGNGQRLQVAEMTALISQDADGAASVNASVAYPMRYRGIPGIAYRLALVAAGEGDLAVSLNSPTGWDVAGGHALLLGAGGDLFGRDGTPVTYSTTGTPQVSLHSCFGGFAELVGSVVHREWRSALHSPPEELKKLSHTSNLGRPSQMPRFSHERKVVFSASLRETRWGRWSSSRAPAAFPPGILAVPSSWKMVAAGTRSPVSPRTIQN